MRWPEVVYKRRKERQNISAFKGLIDEPISIIQLPANIELYVRTNSDVSFGTVAISANERDIAVPALVEGQVHRLGWFERGVEIEVATGFELLIDLGLGRYEAIGTDPVNPWSIPVLPSPVNVTLPTTYYSVNHSGQNVILKGPLSTRTSSMQVLGADAVIMYGVDQTVSPASGGTANFIRDVVNDLWIEGCHIRMGTMGDAFKAGGNVGSNATPTAIPTVTFVNVHIDGVRGLDADTHGDGYQADFHSRAVRMFNVIIETSYQGVFFDPNAANVASRPIIKNGTDLRHCCFRLVPYEGFSDLNSLIYYGDSVANVVAGPTHIVHDVTLVVPTGFDPLRAVRPMTGATFDGEYITLSPALTEKIVDLKGAPAKFRIVRDTIPIRYKVPPAIGYELEIQ